MAKKMTTGIDLCKSQARNIVIHKVSTLPAYTEGMLVYNIVENRLYFGGEGGEWVPLPVSKVDIELGEVSNVLQLPASYLSTDGALTSNSDAKVPSQKATKTYVDGRVTYLQGLITSGFEYKGIFNGTKTIAANGITTITKGWFWKVNPGGTTSGINAPTGLAVGDMIIANATKSSGITAADFDYVPEVLSSDIVLLNANQVLTSKTIDAVENYITNIGRGEMAESFLNDNEDLSGPDPSEHIPTVNAVIAYVAGALADKIKKHTANVNNASSGTIQASAHLCGMNVIVRFYELISNVRTEIEADVSMDDSGNISWSTSNAFTGQIIIMG